MRPLKKDNTERDNEEELNRIRKEFFSLIETKVFIMTTILI